MAFSTLTLFVGPAAGRAAGLGPSPGGWLLDHGRTLGVNTTCPTTDDAELVLVWMEAAARVDPDDAHLCRKTLHNFRMKMSEAEEQGTLTYGALFDEIVRAIVKD